MAYYEQYGIGKVFVMGGLLCLMEPLFLKVEAWEYVGICTHLLSHVQFQPQKPETCSISDICNETL